MKVKWIMFACSIWMMVSCKSEYEKLVKSELATGVVHEDLILGLKMGQSRMEFYAACWNLNTEKKISHGPKNKNVQYTVPKEDVPNENKQIESLFFGIFDEENIMRGLKMRFYYVAWAEHNKDLYANKLIEKVKGYLLNKYEGNDFIEIDVGIDGVETFVKVDGNRQILVFPKDDKEVIVKIEDNRYKLKVDEQ